MMLSNIISEIWDPYSPLQYFGEVKTAPTECEEKCFEMMSPAYRRYSKAP